MSDTFNINIRYIVLSTDIPNNKTYILSLDKESIELPTLSFNKANRDDLNKNIIDYIKTLVFVNDMELIPQIISFNDKNMPNQTEDSVDVVYGFVISLTPSLNNCYWKEFEYLIPNEYSNLVFKAIHALS